MMVSALVSHVVCLDVRVDHVQFGTVAQVVRAVVL